MSVMVIEVANIEEQLGSMKATLDRLLKESVENDAQIKHQNQEIADFTEKLEKQLIEASNKCSDTEDSHEESNHDEESDDKHKAKKDHSLGPMSVEEI